MYIARTEHASWLIIVSFLQSLTALCHVAWGQSSHGISTHLLQAISRPTQATAGSNREVGLPGVEPALRVVSTDRNRTLGRTKPVKTSCPRTRLAQPAHTSVRLFWDRHLETSRIKIQCNVAGQSTSQ